MRYQTPSRTQTVWWVRAIDWWRSLPDDVRRRLRQEDGLTSSSRIVQYFLGKK